MRVEIRSLGVKLGGRWVLRGLDLDLFGSGPQVVALIGPSGSGKSTLLRVLKGLIPAGEGAVYLGGVPLYRGRTPNRTLQKKVGMVYQEAQLVDRLTALENVLTGRLTHLGLLPALLRRFQEKDLALASDLLRRVDLWEHAWKRADALSGGQRQRVGIARALARRPKVLLLDEPYSALDPVLREGLRLEVRALLKREGVTALHVTHDPEEAMLLGDRVGVMAGGRLLEVGPPRRLYEAPASLAAFLAFGRANLLPEGETLLAFRYEEAVPGGSLPARVLERREVRGEVLSRVLLPQGEAWVRLDAPPGAELRLALPRGRRFHRNGHPLPDPGLTEGV
ncbi:ABC transporter ATP-binding protein [Thermus thermophilus]|uniref:ABC transporter ATP-binding protein n=1 Tax=Thermus thermophilus TaxID=274 RepID=UPI001FCA8CBF|nr:ATP-binding cassette domain-containing protein [Thermus thermophilus]BDG23758.1 hypothetical protein TthSNM33_09520 [Thermus thermophilus]